ncbi:MAG: hypothetical protein ABJA66_01780 [Actinomycetota bacterium]
MKYEARGIGETFALFIKSLSAINPGLGLIALKGVILPTDFVCKNIFIQTWKTYQRK